MLAHFIPRTGKGMIVLAIPLFTGIVLAILFDALNLNDLYILPVCLLLSSFIIWFYHGGPALLRDGFHNTPKSRHTLFWIEIKYWGLALGLLGCILLGSYWGHK
jgi:hypothetical protein